MSCRHEIAVLYLFEQKDNILTQIICLYSLFLRIIKTVILINLVIQYQSLVLEFQRQKHYRSYTACFFSEYVCDKRALSKFSFFFEITTKIRQLTLYMYFEF